MTLGYILAALWKRRLLLMATFVLTVGAVVATTLALPKTYTSTATLFVGTTGAADEALAFDANVGEQLARTYTALASNPNVAAAVSARLPFDLGRDEILGRMSFAPVQRTQLLEITAEERSPARAQLLANTYADTFVARVAGQFTKNTTPTRISVSEAGARPSSAARPNPPLYIGLGTVLAALLAAGVALARERLDTRLVIDPSDAQVLGHPVLARIARLPGRGALINPRGADAFRLLRANLDLAAGGSPEAIAVTSGSPKEGKSTICANLAISAATDGERVAVIEADLRRPGLADTSLGTGVELAGGEPGLSSYLVGTTDERGALRPHPVISGVDVMWAGPLPPNPGALLRSDRMAILLDYLARSYDRVLIDTSPMSIGADATLVLAHVPSVVYVIDAGTSAAAARGGLEQLGRAGSRVLGVVLNRAQMPLLDYSSYYPEKQASKSRARSPRMPA